MNSRISACRDPDVLAVVELLRGADVTHAHLEIPLHDFGAADVFGAAEGALSWMRGPTTVADELRWLGVDLVSAASNHALDYSYGGLRSTIETLDADDLAGNVAGIRYAASVADLVIGHLHVQAWDGVDGRMSSTPAFAQEFAHAAVAAGAGVVLVQGSHAPMRGIEIDAGVPILYD